MARFLKIFFGILAVVFLLLLVLPYVFRGPIENKVKEIINKEVNATVSWDAFSLSLIRNFPNMGIGLDGMTIINKAPFDGDTLVNVKRFSLAVDVMSVIKGEAIEVKSILINQPYINLQVNADSIANWDIVPESDEIEVEEDIDEESSDFAIQLRSIRIQDGRLAYSDATMDLLTTINGLNFAMRGDMTESYTTLEMQGAIAALNVKMEGTQYLSKSTVDLTAKIGADLDNMKFTFEDNEILFNKIPLFFEGDFTMLDEGYDMDIRLASSATDFRTLLALVPDEFADDLAGLKTEGTLAIEATAKGVYIDTDHLPAFNLLFEVANGKIQYPDLPKSIDNIAVNMVVENPGGSMDNTIAEIKTFHFELDQSPFNAHLRVVTPISNATFKGGMKGTINLAAMMDAVELENMELKGILKADLMVDGDYNTIEAEKYEEVKANGFLHLTDFEFRSADLPNGVFIDAADMQFTPQFVELKSFICRVGESDFQLNGKLENYLTYVLKDGILKGKLSHYSKFINANELMALSGDEEETVTEEEEPMGTVMIPKNIDFVMSTKTDRILFDNLEMNNTQGALVIKDGRVVMDKVNTHLLNGSVVMNGEYNTQDTLKPYMEFDLAVNSIDINQAANSFSMVDSLLPVAKLAKGSASMKLNFNSLIGEEFSPVLNTLNGGGEFSSKNISLEGSKVQNNLASLLKNDKYKVAHIQDLLVYFTIENGDVKVKPFDVNVFGKKLNIEGTQSLDQTMDYRMRMPVSRAELSSVTGLLGGSLPTSGADVMVGIKITGSVDDPKLKLDVSEATKAITDEVKSAVKEEVKKEADKLIEKAKDEIKNNPEIQEKAKELGDKLKKLF